MDRVLSLFRRRATPRAITVALALYVASVVALGLADARVAAYAPQFAKPDLRFGYNHAQLLDALTTLGEGGRQAYGLSTVVDSLTPVLFAAATVLVVARAMPRWLGALSVAPVLFMVLDLIENAAIGVMLAQYPLIAPGLTAAISPVTMVKLSAYVVAFPTLVLGLVALGYRRLRSPIWRFAAWSVGVIAAIYVLASLKVQPSAFTFFGAALAVLWGVGFLAIVERDRRRT